MYHCAPTCNGHGIGVLDILLMQTQKTGEGFNESLKVKI